VLDHPACGGAVEALEMSNLGCVLALGLAARRHVLLERHLHHDGPADPGDLGEERWGVGNVLEHVGENPEVIGAVGDGHV
jgi:hypothetical protein